MVWVGLGHSLRISVSFLLLGGFFLYLEVGGEVDGKGSFDGQISG